MAGNVRGSFDLSDRPAREALDRIERAGAKADATLTQLGQTVDDIFNDRNLAEAKAYEEALSRVESQGRTTFGSLSRNAREAEFQVVGSIRRMDSSVILLRENLDSLSHSKATPKIDLTGVTEALGQLELVQKRLDSLGRSTATPNVRVPASSMAAGAFGGGGGGGSSFGRGGLDVPFAGSVAWPLVALALGAAPPLLGGATGLLGSAGSAALGAGALGITGAGVGGVAAAVGAPTTILAVKGMKEASKALADYQKQVILTGPNSKSATEKLRLYNIALGKAPQGTGRFLHERTLLSEEFRSATAPAQSDIAGIATRGVNLGRQLTPLAGGIANEFFGSARAQAGEFAGFLNSPGSRAFYTSMGQEASTDLRFVEGTAENVLATLENIARAGRPFFHEGIEFLEDWTSGWKHSTSNLHDTRQEIGGFVDQLKSWGNLGGAGFQLIRDLLAPAAGPGQSMVDDLTEQLETWDRWVQRNPRQVHQFFEDSARGTERIASALGNITHLLWKTGQLLAPLVEQASQLIGVLNSVGLLSPGGMPLLFAARGGINNARSMAKTRILSGGGVPAATEGAPIFLSGGAGGRRGGYAPRTPTSTMTPYGPVVLPLQEEGIVGGRIGRSAAYVGSRASAFGRGFASDFLPYLALSAGLQGISQPGGGEQKIQAALSAATFGLGVDMPKTPAEHRDIGSAQARSIIAHVMRRTGSFKGARRQLQHQLAHTLGLPGDTFFSGDRLGGQVGNAVQRAVTPLGSVIGFEPLSALGIGGGGISAEERQARAKALQQAIKVVNAESREAAGGRGRAALGDIREALGVELRHGQQGARQATLETLGNRIAGFHSPVAGKAFGQEALGLAREIERENPKLKGAVDELAQTIERRFERMGEQVKIIHGRIVDVSTKSWEAVANAIDSNTQRAYARGSKNLTALEQRAFDILREMGFSKSTAMQITRQALHGGEAGKLAGEAQGAGKATAEVHGHLDPHFLPGRHGATGMRLGGQGLHDTVNLGGGNFAAPGELVSNRHTERRIDQMLAPYGTTMGREIAREGRAHSEQFRAFATGGRTGSNWRGIGPAGLHSGIRKVAADVLGHFPGLSVTSTTGGSHVSGSYHYLGEAVDVAGSTGVMHAASEWIKRSGLYRQLTEGIHNPNLSVNEGHFVDPSYYSAVWAEHANHIHLAVAHAVGQLLGGGGGFGRRSGAGGGGFPQIHLKGLKSGMGGLTGAISDRANSMVAAGMSKRLNAILGKRGGGLGGGGLTHGGGSRSAVERQIAQVLFRHGANRVGAAGIIGNAYRESGMDPGAEGTGGGGLWGFTSGAISLANLKRAGGSNWENPGFQTEFMLRHGGQGLLSRLNRAGSPEKAAALFMQLWERPGIPALADREAGARVAFNQGFSTGGRTPGFAGWYARGGHFRVSRPTIFGVGENGAEDVHILPRNRRGGSGGGHSIEVKVDMRGSNVGHGNADQIGRKIGKGIVSELIDALDRSDSVPERALTG